MTRDGSASVLRWGLEHPELQIGWVVAEGVVVEAADAALAGALEREIARVAAEGVPEPTRRAVRDLLRRFGYRPAGRGKPASEFLAGAAARGRFPRINNVVDANNLLSLATGLPATLLDLDRAAPAGEPLEVRLGRPGERYVFNPAGQEIELGGLVVVARVGGAALGNPVKDSMATKIRQDTRRVLGVVYSSRRLHRAEELRAVADEYGELLRRHAGAERVATGVLPRS